MKFSNTLALLFIGSASAFAPANLNAARSSVCFTRKSEVDDEFGRRKCIFIALILGCYTWNI